MKPDDIEATWARHNAEWRDTAQIASQWVEADNTDPEAFHYRVRGPFWATLAAHGITLLVTREYEHLVIALRADSREPVISYMRIPHPSGLTVDRVRGVVHVASTRNPNQIFDLVPIGETDARLDSEPISPHDHPLLPIRSRFFPGSLYIHDLAMIAGALHANSVGQNAIVRVHDDGHHERVWWPRCIEVEGQPVFGQNHIQLNSIAAGATLEDSHFSASADKISARRPGHRNFPVDRRGVIFDGRTRDVLARGLTRPHSARAYKDHLWVDNSGYGELGYVEDGKFRPCAKLPGWTRGLCFHEGVAFVGTSRVIPRFRGYAPGLEVEASVCGVHAVELTTGEVIASMVWPKGNQIFAIEWLPAKFSGGFPFRANQKAKERDRLKRLFYTFKLSKSHNAEGLTQDEQ